MPQKIIPKNKLAILKELKKKKLKEIEEAENLIFEAEKESDVHKEESEIKFKDLQEKLRKGSFSSDDDEQEVNSDKQNDDETEVGDENNLELIVDKEKTVSQNNNLTNPQINSDYNTNDQNNIFNDYISELSVQPTKALYQEITDIYQESKDRGYVSPENFQKINNLTYAMNKKVDDANSGKYTLSEEIKSSISFSEQIKKKMNVMYKP